MAMSNESVLGIDLVLDGFIFNMNDPCTSLKICHMCIANAIISVLV